jgi:Fur family ferric uptake transcriptional regulator
VEQDWRTELRARGYRLTPQRELVLHAVETLGHATPDEVLAEVRKDSESLNISTVYRSLELLEELGLLRHSHITDRAPTYHAASNPTHLHLVCRECGSVTDVDPAKVAPMAATLADEFDFETDIGHLTVFGRCANCRGAG